MAGSREPNPLRPYYTPPSIDEASTAYHGAGGHNASSNHVSPAPGYGSFTRNVLSDMDYSEYISGPSSGAADAVKGLLEQATWKYTSLFMAQPFEVAKIILQVQAQTSPGSQPEQDGQSKDRRARKQDKYRHDSFEAFSSDSDLDSPSYFTSSAPLAQTPSRLPRGRRRRSSSSPDHRPQNDAASSRAAKRHILNLKSSSSIMGTISTLWNAEGAWGIWKGTNSTFVFSILSSTVSSFIRSVFSAVLALPDPGLSFSYPSSGPSSLTGGLDILTSPFPLASLTVAVSAAGLTGIILAPVDMVRTKLVLTPITHPPRSIIATLKSLPTWLPPSALLPIVLLNSTLPTFLSASTPLFLRSNMNIDPLLTPNLYNISTFFSQTLELSIRLPIETVLRRGQIHHISHQTGSASAMHQSSISQQLDTIVEPGPFKGFFGTMRSIIYEEANEEQRQVDSTLSNTAGDVKKGKSSGRQGVRRRKGQGVEGLYRGWRVGMWGIVGVWGAAALGGAGSKGGRF